MSAALVSEIESSGSVAQASSYQKFFSNRERKVIEGTFLNVREQSPSGSTPERQCETNLFFGFFHDGTRKNLYRSLQAGDHSESNIGRLYLAYPGRGAAGIAADKEVEWKSKSNEFNDYKNYFRTYAPGVGSRFRELGDSGENLDRTLGSAFAYMGERRIIWTLVQAVNNLHRYFLGKEMISNDEVLTICQKIHLSSATLHQMTGRYDGYSNGEVPGHVTQSTPRTAFEEMLRRLHAQIRYHIPDPQTCKVQNSDPAQVKEIFVSAFGFSRGATAARVFLNWLIALCRLDAQLLGKDGTTLGGFPVTFDFLGLFDTVASVGLANTFGLFNGHDAWADAEVSLRVPPEVRCLHLVAAHEVRRSFPLDSISVKGQADADQHQEVVYPGVHSDIGGGYVPKEQGKGRDPTGKDMLSRVTLAHMYRAARLSGVPLKLESAEQRVKDGFLIDPAVVTALNQYIKHCKVRGNAGLTAIMREQRKLYILWRLTRRGDALVNALPSIDERRADQNDLEGANGEFEKEIQDFEQWLESHHSLQVRPLAPKPQAPGFNNSSKQNEWEEVALYWGKEVLPEGMAELFDQYIHDSHAWFKLNGTEADDVEAELREWVRKKNGGGGNPQLNRVENDPLTPNQWLWASKYEATGEIPKMPTSGRESLNGAGYLRYRRIYAGADFMLISRVPRSTEHPDVANREAPHGGRLLEQT